MTWIPTKEDQKTAFGELITAKLSPQFQGTFEYTVSNTELNTNTVAGSGGITQANAMASVSTGTTIGSTALFQTRQHAKYRSGFGGLSRFSAIFTSPVAGTEQYVGILDEIGSSAAFKNGFAIGYDGTTFGLHRFQNDSKTTVAIASWDDPLDGTGASGMTIDHTKGNVWAIRYQYLGFGAIQLFVEDDVTGEFALVHTIDYANQNTTPSTHNPNYHHTIWTNNKATTSDMVIKSASYAYFIEGDTGLIELHQPQFSSGLKQKTTVTTETAIFTIRNKSTYAAKTNFIDIILERVGASIEAAAANNLGSIRLIKNTALGGTPSYTDISTTDSVVDIDTAGTTVTGGKTLLTIPLANKNDKFAENVVGFNIILNPGETLTVAGTSTNSATINATCLWKELF